MSQLNRFIIPCWLTLALFAPLAQGQSADQLAAFDDNVQDLILKARTSHYDPLFGQSAIPVLKEAFANASDTSTRVNLANVLLMFGEKDDAYWTVLYKRAEEIVNSSAPYPLVFDDKGKTIRGAISPEFLEWVKDNNLPKDEA